MTDSPLEELENHEHMEHAQHAAHSGGKLLTYVSITIAVLAVLSAVVGSLETVASGQALSQKNEAVLSQARASDSWAFYQAKSLKKHIYGLAADQGGPKADKYRKTQTENAADEEKIQDEAKAFEKERDAKLKLSETAEGRHHKLTVAATLMHMGIAIATISIIANKKWPWLSSLVLAVAGSAVAIWAYV
jgi:glycerate-2-kinase